MHTRRISRLLQSVVGLALLGAGWLGLVIFAAGCSNGGGHGATNGAPEVYISIPAGVLSGDITLDFILVDADGDPVDLVLEYTLDGATFLPLSLAPESPSVISLAADSDGESHVAIWDSIYDGVGMLASTSVRIRITARDALAEVTKMSKTFRVDNTTTSNPALLGLSPDRGTGGTVVTIDALDLGDDPDALRVFFGEAEAHVISLTTAATRTASGYPSTVVVIAPPEVETSPVRLEITTGVQLTGPIFHGAPRIDSVRPAVIYADGTEQIVDIRGSVLDDGAVQVTFSTASTSVSLTPTSIDFDLLSVPFPIALHTAAVGLPIEINVATAGGESNRVGIFLSDSSATDMPPSVTELRVPPRSRAGRLPLDFTVYDLDGLDLAALEISASIDGGPFLPFESVSDVAASPVGLGLSHRLIVDTTALASTFVGSLRWRVDASELGVPGVRWTAAPVWVDGEEPRPTQVAEEFETNDWELVEETSADWNDALGSFFGEPGALVGVAGSEPRWGDGSDGVFHPQESIELQTDGVDPAYGGKDGVFRFTSFTLDSGVVLTARGSNPLDIRVSGPAAVQGTIFLSGGNGGAGSPFGGGPGGLAGPGGSPGGAGGYVTAAGLVVDGESAVAGGRGGHSTVSLHSGAVGGGGGGGGFERAGRDGSRAFAPGSGLGGAGGTGRGGTTSEDLTPGVGGGGGGGSVDPAGRPSGGGGGGGGGGGAVRLTAAGDITVGGAIHCDGGTGGTGFASGSGGGGSGGSIVIRTPQRILFHSTATLTAKAGSGGTTFPWGGSGTEGTIRFESPFPLGLPSGPSLDLTGWEPGEGAPGFSLGEVTVAALVVGDGSDGAFRPSTDVVLNTDGIDPNFGGNDGEFHFTTVDIPAGVTVTATGRHPLVVRATEAIHIAGTLDVSGAEAPPVAVLPPTPGRGGSGGPGGGRGGSGGHYDAGSAIAVRGETGGPPANFPFGFPNPGGGGAETVAILDSNPPGPTSSGGGGGGAGGSLLGDAGASGAPPFGTSGGVGGPISGFPDFRDPNDSARIVLLGGGGGGGGGGNINDEGIFGGGTPGGGGGGGGGACLLVSGIGFTLTEMGHIDARGGDGASSSTTGLAGNGGGGAGGAVLVQAPDIRLLGGSILATGGESPLTGGTPGGRGSVGRIRLETASVGAPAVVVPSPITFGSFDPTVRFSAAVSKPIPIATSRELLSFGRTLIGSRVEPTPSVPAQVEVLWGSWQADPQDPRRPVLFSGFSADPVQVPPGEFLQFKVLMLSSHVAPARVDRVIADLD